MMLAWDLDAVATFLGADVVHEENSSYTLRFPLLRGEAVLRIFPYNGDVDLKVFQNSDSSEPSATWRLDCAAIEYQNDEPDEGGEGIAFIPKGDSVSRASHRFSIGRNGDQFELSTVFYHPE